MNDLAFALAVSIAINGLFFAAAAVLKTDKVTDLSYSLSFLAIDCSMLLRSGRWDAGRLVVGGLVALWSLRLGAYLLGRIIATGVDHRFDGIREDFRRFARFWVLQALTVWIVSLPAILFLGGGEDRPAGTVVLAAAALAAAALAFEALADAQKSAFHRHRPEGESFIATGLWKLSRHPNYFGECLFWWAVFVACLPALSGPGYLAAIGPVFISALIAFVSGVPLLEKEADLKHGSDPKYLLYKQKTSILLPLPPRRQS
jgi:steroid 5-alpha reductase family enzyme